MEILQIEDRIGTSSRSQYAKKAKVLCTSKIRVRDTSYLTSTSRRHGTGVISLQTTVVLGRIKTMSVFAPECGVTSTDAL